MNSYYFRGVAIGLLISGVTSGLAYLKAGKAGQTNTLLYLTILELVLCAIFSIISVLIS